MGLKSLLPVRRDSRRDVQPFAMLHREIDRIFDEFFRGFPSISGFEPAGLPVDMDIAEGENETELTVELPGLDATDVDISVAGDVLTIKGEKKAEKVENDKSYRFVERSYGSFLRSVDLPAGIDPDSIRATMANGILKVIVPKPAAAESKKIEIKAAA